MEERDSINNEMNVAQLNKYVNEIMKINGGIIKQSMDQLQCC